MTHLFHLTHQGGVDRYLVSTKKTRQHIDTSTVDAFPVEIIEHTNRKQLFNDHWELSDEGVDVSTSSDFYFSPVQLPHDFSIHQPFSTNNEAESGFLPGGTRWYRKQFLVNPDLENKRFMIEFDGIYMSSEVYLNGKLIATHHSGYTPFAVELTDEIKFGALNTLLVKVTNEIPSSRWYSGSGIYRDVYFSVLNPLAIDYQGLRIKSQKKNQDFELAIQTNVKSQWSQKGDYYIKHTLLDETGDEVISFMSTELSVEPRSVSIHEEKEMIHVPHLWSPDHPYLYKVMTEVLHEGKVVDRLETPYGFRYCEFDRDQGFSINGQPTKLKGVSMHHDQGSLGAVALPDALKRQLMLLKDMGANAIRSTHNPAAPLLVQLADQYGFLVINEAFDGWDLHKNGNVNDFSKYFNEPIEQTNGLLNATPGMTWAEMVVQSMVKSSFNSPSVIMWSIGNEITEGTNLQAEHFPTIAAKIMDWIEAIDPTRPLTIGDNRSAEFIDYSILEDINTMITQRGGIVGKNYKSAEAMNQERQKHPDWIMYGSETASAVHSRTTYHTYSIDNQTFEISSYDNDFAKVGWGSSASDSWKQAIEHDWNLGEFVWTGFDYLGEPTPWNGISPGSVTGQGAKPNASYFGIIDTAGFPKDTYYLYRSMWNDKDVTLHLMPTWNEAQLVKNDDGKVQVDVFTNAPHVALYLNDQLIDEQKATVHTTPLGFRYLRFNGKPYPSFFVDYEPGEITVKAYDESGKAIHPTRTSGRHSIQTAGKVRQIQVTTSFDCLSNNARDLVYIELSLVDENKTIVEGEDRVLYFDLEGPGEIVGVDNGCQSDTMSYKGTKRKTYKGKALVILQSTKEIGQMTLAIHDEKGLSTQVEVEVKETKEVKPRAFWWCYHYAVQKGQPLVLQQAIQCHNDNQALMIQWHHLPQETKQGTVIVDASILEGKYTLSSKLEVIPSVCTLQNQTLRLTRDEDVLAKLPNYVYGLDQKGNVLPTRFEVAWDKTAIELADEQPQIISGKANVLGEAMRVFLKLVIEEEAMARNLASHIECPDLMIQSWYVKNGVFKQLPCDRLFLITQGHHHTSPSLCVPWSNETIKEDDVEIVLEFSWDQPISMNNLNLWHYIKEEGDLPGPENVRFDYLCPQSQAWRVAEHSNITQVPYFSAETAYGLVYPITTQSLRIYITPPRNGVVAGLTNVEIYEHHAEVELSHKSQIETITVNDSITQSLSKFEWDLPIEELKMIDVHQLNNGVATLFDIDDERLLIHNLAEDGRNYSVYRYLFKK